EYGVSYLFRVSRCTDNGHGLRVEEGVQHKRRILNGRTICKEDRRDYGKCGIDKYHLLFYPCVWRKRKEKGPRIGGFPVFLFGSRRSDSSSSFPE
ncbi:MAG TPA: hypothetical protein VEI96_05565, partial [Thermodesulfovibrionales bacterium]|nr:hypothetical protein [Thermodesulfovibrionales bacterium]